MQARTTMLERTATSQGLKVYVPVLRYLYMYCSSTAVGVAHVLAAPLQSADGVDNYMWHTAYCIHGLQLSFCNLDSLQLRNRGRESLPRISWQAICVAETLLVLFEYTTIHHESNQQISNVDISLTTCT